MKYLFPIILFLTSCSYLIVEQTSQDKIEEKSSRIREEAKKNVLINPRLFDSLVYYADTVTEIPEHLRANQSPFLGPLTEKRLIIVGYGAIKHGKLIHSSNNENVIEIIDSLLFLNITDGGGYPILPTTNCDLIWDGKYYSDIDGEKYVELVFSYVNPDICRALIHRTLQFDLSPLKHSDVNKIKINISGYYYDLYYSY